MSISITTKNDVWWNLGDTCRLSLYYAELAQKMERKSTKWKIILVLTGAISAIVSLFPDSFSSYLQVASGASISLLVGLIFAFGHDRKAAVLHTVTTDIMLLRRDWKSLWAEIQENEIEEEIAKTKNRTLGEKLEHITSRADFVGVVDDDELDTNMSKKVERIMINEFRLEKTSIGQS